MIRSFLTPQQSTILQQGGWRALLLSERLWLSKIIALLVVSSAAASNWAAFLIPDHPVRWFLLVANLGMVLGMLLTYGFLWWWQRTGIALMTGHDVLSIRFTT